MGGFLPVAAPVKLKRVLGHAEIDGSASKGMPSGARAPRAVVLYIEDDADNAELVRVLLSRDRRIALIVAPDGSTGLAAARIAAPNLILLDLGLPDMTGLEVLEALRRDRVLREARVMVVTADADARDSAGVRAAGVGAFVIKPIEIRQFLEVVDHALFPRGAVAVAWRFSSGGGQLSRDPGRMEYAPASRCQTTR